MLTDENKKKLNDVIIEYRGWIAFAVGFVTGLFIGLITHSWQLLEISAFIAGLFATTYKRGVLYGGVSILAVYSFFLLIYVLTTPAFQVMDIFAGILINGIVGINVSGMGIVGFLITLLIGFLIGISGGYFGAVIHSFISWPEAGKTT